eukprot:7432414-Ditylum_brightwellii.AAC.1
MVKSKQYHQKYHYSARQNPIPSIDATSQTKKNNVTCDSRLRNIPYIPNARDAYAVIPLFDLLGSSNV